MYAGDETNGDEVTSGVTRDGDQDDDPESADNHPVLYMDGARVVDMQDEGGNAVDTYELERVQLEFDDTANGVQSEAQERGALGWCNSATIHLDREEDSVTVLISVGDPRGAFAFTVRRIPTDDPTNPNAGLLVMHTPNPGESMPHETLFEIRPGTYAIGRAWKDRE